MGNPFGPFPPDKAMRRPALRLAAINLVVLANMTCGIVASGQEPSGKMASNWDDCPAERPAIPEPRFLLLADAQKMPAAKDAMAPEGGAALFGKHCTTCHDAEKALSKKKTLAAWQTTVQKMAEKEDADIPKDVREPIAQYLASRGSPSGNETGELQEKLAAGGTGSDLSTKEKDGGKSQPDNSALIQQGKTAFETSCVTCHGAEKSLQASKSISAWRVTVRRMAEKDGAHVPDSTHEAIAIYLASLNKGKGEKDSAATDSGPSVSVAGTLSAKYRNSGDPDLEDPGQFGDAWIGFAWQPKGPVSGRVTTCISCHSQGIQLGNFELVEATLRLDVNKCACPNNPDALPFKLNVEAGRFVVPFGAYYQEVNPGVDRAVSPPLIYNMGQRVYPNNIGDPVLPMPYSDEGASMNLTLPLSKTTSVTLNSYALNGLEGNNSGIDFYQSRDYVDNNRWPAVGGRLTLNGQYMRFAASVMGGRFNGDNGAGPQNEGLNYLIFGGDAQFRWKDVFRLQFEFAQRQSDRYGGTPTPTVFSERVWGYYLEGELLIWRKRHISLFARYDWQMHDSPLPVLGSQIATGDFIVDRITYGVNWTLPGGSLLMINDEIWNFPQGIGAANVLGVRWAATF
jgi:mono/diheme cytochrome c family protein